MKKIRRWKSWWLAVLGFVAVTLGGFRSTAWSEDVAPPASTQTLEQRVNILERKLEVAEEAAQAKSKDSITARADKDGFALQNADKSFVLKIGALLQADGRFFVDDKAGSEVDQFLIRRARPSLSGTIFRDLNFLIAPDFASNGKTTLYDAYLDIAPWTFAKLRVGKFKPPIGLEHLQSDPYTNFTERAFPSLLVPSRDTGLQLFGDLWNGAASYALAFTNGVGDNNTNAAPAPATSDTDANDGKEGTARLAFKPFKNTDAALLQGLGFGFGASYAKQAGQTPNYTTPGQLSIFSANTVGTVLPDGEHIRLAPELNWYYHSIGVLGEWVQSSQVWRVNRVRTNFVNQAWQAGGTYVLTGEDASYTGVKPRKPFDPKAGTWGAIELAARYQELYLDPDHFTQGAATVAGAVQRASGYSVGFHWYLNNIVRFITDYSQTTFDKGAAFGDRPDEKVVISRWQLYF